MTEENKDIVKTEEVVEKVEEKVEQVEVKETSGIEQQAMEMGWRPRDEFDGTDDDFIDAKEFVRRKPLFDKIESNSRELKAVRRALEQFKQHYSMVKETEYNRAMDALKKQRKLALEEGDGDKFEAIDTEIKNVETQVTALQKEKNSPIVQEEAQLPQEFVMWKDRNRWYETKPHMKVYADNLGVDLAKRGLNPSEVLRQVEKEVKQYFQTEFKNPRKESAPDVDSSRTQNRGPSKKDDYPLSDEERKVMNDFVRQGLMTKDEYIQSLKDADKYL